MKMVVFEQICRDIIKQIRKYADEGRLNKILDYLDKKEEQINKLSKVSHVEEEYVDELVKNLK